MAAENQIADIGSADISPASALRELDLSGNCLKSVGFLASLPEIEVASP